MQGSLHAKAFFTDQPLARNPTEHNETRKTLSFALPQQCAKSLGLRGIFPVA
jgi:hypothetical protein